MKRCFIISPIGQEGSSIREHADDVYEYIIAPAMAMRDIAAVRSDHLQEPGKISDQMYREIFQSDLCVAVLWGHNPNVFYELGVAHSAGKPVIILNEKSEVLPFDIRDLRCVSYDLKPRSLFDQIFVKQIVLHLDNLETLNWKVPPPFREYCAPAPEKLDAGLTVHGRHQEYGGTEKWLALIRETQKKLWLLSLSLDSWKSRRGFRESLLAKAQEGCEIRLLTMAVDNPVLPLFSASYDRPGGIELIRSEISLMNEYFRSLVGSEPRIQWRVMKTGCPHFRMTLTDHKSLMVPYLFGDSQCPLFESPASSPLNQIAANEFEDLWNSNS